MALYLCIDCGGTKVAAVVANNKGDILGRGRGGPANFKDVSSARFVSSVRDAVEAALATIEPTAANIVNKQLRLNTDGGEFKSSRFPLPIFITLPQSPSPQELRSSRLNPRAVRNTMSCLSLVLGAYSRRRGSGWLV